MTNSYKLKTKLFSRLIGKELVLCRLDTFWKTKDWNVHNFDRVTLLVFATRELPTKEYLNKKKQVIGKTLVCLKIKNWPIFYEENLRTKNAKC